MNNDKKISLIKKFLLKYKNYNPFIELTLDNYNGYNLFITMSFDKKNNILKLFYVDLDAFNPNKIKYFINEQLVFPDFYDNLLNILNNEKLENFVDINPLYPDRVKMIINTLDKRNYSFEFSRYISHNHIALSVIIVKIFDYLPYMLQIFNDTMHDLLLDRVNDYNKIYNFDLFNDDINLIFHNDIIERSKEYNVSFLEKIGNMYYAVVSGTNDYLVTIYYDDKKNISHFYCSCPCDFNCKHIATVIRAIRNKEVKKFYKLAYNKGIDLIDRLLNKNFILCLDVDSEGYIVADLNTKCITKIPLNEKVYVFEDIDNYLTNKLKELK